MWEIIKKLWSCDTVEYISGISMMAIMVGIFLTVFFFTYVASIESAIVKHEVKFLADNFAENVKLLPPDAQESLRAAVLNIKLPDFTDTNDKIDSINGKIKFDTLLIMGLVGVAIFAIVFVVSMKRFCDFSFMDMFGKSALILLFVGLTEFAFLNLVPVHYYAVDPNHVKYYMLNAVFPNAQPENVSKKVTFSENIQTILSGEDELNSESDSESETESVKHSISSEVAKKWAQSILGEI